MVYYIKAMAKGAAKMALPIAFAASALTPAMAETGNTTLKLKGFDKIAYDDTKEVAIVLTAQEADRLSMVEFNVIIPEGLEYVPGTFQKRSLDQLKNHTFKMEPNSEGFHVGIYNDDMKTMGTLNEDTIATFRVKANTKLTGRDDMGLEIVDLTDADAEQLPFENTGANEVEGGEGDNSIGLYGIEIDENMIPGSWEVYVTGDNVNATRDTMTIDPDESVYTPQTVEVNLRVSEAKVGGIQFNLMLPEGMTLLTETVEANAARTKEKSANYKVISVDEQATNDYVIFISGDTKAIDGKDGVLISFQVVVDSANTMAAEDSIKLEGIRVTSIHNVTLEQDDIKVVVENLNQAAKNRIDAAYELVDNFAKQVTDNENRVYDYSEVLAARQAVLDRIDDNYWDGVLHIDGNEAAIMALIAAYESAVDEAYKANNLLYARYNKELLELRKALKDLIPAGVQYPDFEMSSRLIDGKLATTYAVADFVDPVVKEKYIAAYEAIAAFENKVNELWAATDSVTEADNQYASAEMFDGELLTDSAEVNALKAAADAAIEAFGETLETVNDATAEDMKKLVNDNDDATSTDLAGILAEAIKTVGELSPAHHNDIDNTLLNATNFPEIQEAIAAAQEAIDAVTPVIEASQAAGTLPFKEGIQPVVDAFQNAKDKIDALIELANELMEANDQAYDNWEGVIQDLEDGLGDLAFIAEDDVDDTQTYQDAYQAAADAIQAVQDLLDEKDKEAMVDKSFDLIDAAKEKAEATLDSLNQVINNLSGLNEQIDGVEDALEAAKDKLQDAIDNNDWLEHGINTEEDIDAIKAELEDIENKLDSLTDLINNAEPWENVYDEENVERWSEELDDLLKRLNGEDGEADGEGGVDEAIDDAVEKYQSTHKRGDTDLDGEIDLADYVEALNYVLEKKTLENYSSDEYKRNEKFDALDVTYNDKINVGDAVATANIVDHGTPEDRYARMINDVPESLTASEQTVNGKRTIALSLTNGRAYVAAQMDIVLPEGMRLAGVQLGSRNAGHQLLTATTAEGAQRIVIASKTNELFEGGEGDVLYLTVEGAGDVQFENVILADASARDYEFTVGAAQTTGIAGVKAAAAGEQTYSIGGRLMNAVKKGISIVRRADGNAQKVIKK